MIDELRADSITKVADCANYLRSLLPQWEGRWGVHLVNGEAVSHANLQPAVDALLDANAVLVPEFYPQRSRYCSSGGSAAARDQWLADFFRGGQGAFTQARFAWLVARRVVRKSSSQLSMLFGVTDAFLDGINPGIFLDRMFYVWVTRSAFRGTALVANDGPGSWKWDLPYMSQTSRDQAFMASFNHYSVNGSIGSSEPRRCRRDSQVVACRSGISLVKVPFDGRVPSYCGSRDNVVFRDSRRRKVSWPRDQHSARQAPPQPRGTLTARASQAPVRRRPRGDDAGRLGGLSFGRHCPRTCR